MSKDAEARGLAEPFKGVTSQRHGRARTVPDPLHGSLHRAGADGRRGFPRGAHARQRARTTFTVDDPEWRKWMNQHFYVRQGVSFQEMTEAQREAAFGLLRAALSAKGLKLSRDIMKLNYTLGELNHDDFEQYGEWLYHVTVMGEPSASRALGLPGRRPPLDHQLLRARRSGRDVAFVLGLRARHRQVRQVRGDRHPAGRAQPGAGAAAGALRGAAREGDPVRLQDRERQRGRGLQGQRRPRLRGRAGHGADRGPETAAAGARRRVRGQPARRPGARADERRRSPPRRHVLRVDRRQPSPTASSTTASTAP